jgi:hypothetical protein
VFTNLACWLLAAMSCCQPLSAAVHWLLSATSCFCAACAAPSHDDEALVSILLVQLHQLLQGCECRRHASLIGQHKSVAKPSTAEVLPDATSEPWLDSGGLVHMHGISMALW